MISRNGFFMFLILLILFVICFPVTAEDLPTVESKVEKSAADLDGLDTVPVADGGTLIINFSDTNTEINIKNLIIENGGKLTYHSSDNDRNLDVKFNVEEDAVIDGIIDFKGKDGSNGEDGDSDGEKGEDGGSGLLGKSIKIHAKTINFSGKINTIGGKGGKGGRGNDDTGFEGFLDPFNEAGDGGRGGDGGNGGKVIIDSDTINLNRGIINSSGGKGGQGGARGHAGAVGSNGDPGKGGSGGNAGKIELDGSYVKAATKFKSLKGGKGLGGYNQENEYKGDSAGLSRKVLVLAGYGDIKDSTFKPSKEDYWDDHEPEVEEVNFEMKGNLHEEIIYTNNSNPRVEWNEFEDISRPHKESNYTIKASGLNYYNVFLTKMGGNEYRFNEVPDNEVRLNPSTIDNLSNGLYELQLNAVDNNSQKSNKKPVPSFEFVVDTEHPDEFVLKDPYNVTSNEAILSWEKSRDDVSFVSSYELEIINQITDEDTIIKNIDPESNLSERIDNDRFSNEDFGLFANQKIKYKVIAEDAAGNRTATNWDRFVTAPAVSGIDKGASEATAKQIKLKIKSVGKGADKYKIIRYVEDEGEYIQDHETTWYGQEELEKNDYYIVDDHNLEPRTTYRYRVKTKNSSKQEYDWNTRLSNETEITLENNPPKPGDVIRPAEGAILEVVKDEEIELAVEPFRDSDGDELDYDFVIEQNNQGTWEEINPSGERIVEGEAVKLMLSEGLHQGEYRWRVRASDGEETTQNDYHYFEVEWLESPEISWPGNDRSIYKGEEISLTVEFTDPDKVIEKYEVDYGDGNIESGDNPGDELEISHRYETLSGEEGFPLRVTLQDAGGEITEEINIFVTNTLSGSLRMNEQWSGKMELEDDVIVPQGKTLIINSGTEVIFPSGSALKVSGSLIVSGTSDNRIQFKSEDKEPGNWAGIFVAEEAEAPEIYYAVMKYAHKGLTLVTKNKGEIENTEFQDNLVGLHLYGSSPDILSSDFFNNELYGIKEDKDCQPYLEGNTFESNQIADYYDSELTELSQDELEEIK